tara:strand:- start:48 stop:476 length:429 start_codon:yes stop_codon:yes gene_type:complete
MSGFGIIDIHFPIQMVMAHQDHDQNEPFSSRNNIDVVFTVQEGKAKPFKYVASVTVRSENQDEEPSAQGVNVPYRIAFQCVVKLEYDGERKKNTKALEKSARTTSIQVAIGAIRERMASLTARAPWGVISLGILEDDIIRRN